MFFSLAWNVNGTPTYMSSCWMTSGDTAAELDSTHPNTDRHLQDTATKTAMHASDIKYVFVCLGVHCTSSLWCDVWLLCGVPLMNE